MRKLLILSILCIATACNDIDQETQTPSVSGLWCAEKIIYADKVEFERRHSKTGPPKQSCILFTEQERLVRFSADKGRQILNVEYLMNGDEIQLSGVNKNKYLPIGKLIAPNQLLMDFKRGRKMLLNRMPDGTNPELLELDKTLSVEFSTQAK